MPIGIPVLYAVILWRKRELRNPQIRTIAMPDPDGTDEAATRADSAEGAGIFSWFFRTIPKSEIKNESKGEGVEEAELIRG